MINTHTTAGRGVLSILLVEDDVELANSIKGDLDKQRISSRVVGKLEEARVLLNTVATFDAVVLDLNLPDGNGVDLARDCRKAGLTIPIIMVTGRDAVEDRVNGLRHGADDYVCKPFAVDELIARIEAVCRRNRRVQGHSLRYHDIEVDLLKRCLRRHDMEVALSTRELDLLVYFMSNPEQVLEKKRILRDVWGDGAEGDDNLLQVYTNYLRNKLENGRFSRVLHTVRSVGYILADKEPAM